MKHQPLENPYFDQLTENLSFMSARTFQNNRKFRQHPQLAAICPEYIYTSYCVASSTVPLMEETLRCAQELPDDPICEPLSDYLRQHIEEERNHDEWVIRDLMALGMTRAEITSRLQPPNVAALIGSQYYWVRHHHPVAFMGYIGTMEVYPPTVEYVENLIRDSGLPAAGFDTLMMHAKVDVEHRKDIIALLNTLPLEDHHREIVEMSAFQTHRYMALIMDDICRSSIHKPG